MLKAHLRFVTGCFAAATLTCSGSAALAWSWSPLAHDAKEDADCSTNEAPVVDSIRPRPGSAAADQADPADNAGKSDVPGKMEGLKEESPLSEFDRQVAKPLPKRAQAADDEAAPERPREKKVSGKMPDEVTVDPEYYYKRSRNFVRDGDLQSALNYVNKALELNPEFWEAWYEKAMIYQVTGYDAAAARRYLELIKHRPEMAEAHIGLGSLYRKHHNYELAEGEYKTVIDDNFSSFEAHYNLANVYMEQEKLEPALKEYKVCLKLKPTSGIVHNNLGVIYEKRNFLDEAAQEFTKASHLEPANQQFADNLSEVKVKLGQKSPKSVNM